MFASRDCEFPASGTAWCGCDSSSFKLIHTNTSLMSPREASLMDVNRWKNSFVKPETYIVSDSPAVFFSDRAYFSRELLFHACDYSWKPAAGCVTFHPGDGPFFGNQRSIANDLPQPRGRSQISLWGTHYKPPKSQHSTVYQRIWLHLSKFTDAKTNACKYE